MEEILNKLYSYEYFNLYLISAIVVLVILFFVILFVGKKDKKEREIETTKKLEKINNEDAFKSESNETPLEFADKSLEDDTIMIPTIGDLNEQPINNELNDNMTFDSVSVDNDIKEPEMNMDNFDVPSINSVIDNPISDEPILEKVEEKPLVVEEDIVSHIDETGIELGDEEPKIMSFDELLKSDEDNVIDEPTIPIINPVKEELKDEIVAPISSPNEEMPVPSKEEIDMELPALKKEVQEEKKEEIEKPVLTDYNLDELSGETYDINK